MLCWSGVFFIMKGWKCILTWHMVFLHFFFQVSRCYSINNSILMNNTHTIIKHNHTLWGTQTYTWVISNYPCLWNCPLVLHQWAKTLWPHAQHAFGVPIWGWWKWSGYTFNSSIVFIGPHYWTMCAVSSRHITASHFCLTHPLTVCPSAITSLGEWGISSDTKHMCSQMLCLCCVCCAHFFYRKCDYVRQYNSASVNKSFDVQASNITRHAIGLLSV